MKLITTIVRPHKVEDVKRALHSVHACRLTIHELQDHAPQPHQTAVWRGHVYHLGFSAKMEIRVIVDDDEVDDVVGAILRAARTGEIGDGDVSVLPVEHRYSIRSGQRGTT